MDDPDEDQNPQSEDTSASRKATGAPMILPYSDEEQAAREQEQNDEEPVIDAPPITPAFEDARDNIEPGEMPPLEETPSEEPASEENEPSGQSSDFNTRAEGAESPETGPAEEVTFADAANSVVSLAPAGQDGHGTAINPRTGRPERVLVSAPRMGVMEMFGILLQIIVGLFSGDQELSFALIDNFFPPDEAARDPAIAARRQNLRDHVDPDNPNFEENRREALSNPFQFAREFLQGVDYGRLQTLKPHLDSLFNHIIEHESSGRANVVWDYRKRTQPEKSWPGLQPGDTTPGGLTVPQFQTMTTDAVQEWQRQYLEEQYTLGGIERGTGSSAIGLLQFTKSRLDGLESAGLISGDEILSIERQLQLGVQGMLHDYDLTDFLNKDISVSDMMANLGSEWQGLQHGGDQDAWNELRTILTNMQNAGSPTASPSV